MLICLIPFHAYGQSTQHQEEEVIRVDADLVLLNVTVTDLLGRYVHKVPRSEFTIFEDGRVQQLNFFSVEETPFAATILLDTSGSMEGRLTMARAAAINFLDRLRTEDVASVYHFNSKVEQLQDFSSSRDLSPMTFDLQPTGYTVLNDAILRAARDLSVRPEKRRAIIVISDGSDTRSAATSEKALNGALAANATIYTVDMMDPQASASERQSAAGALKNFSIKSGGRYVSAPGGRALSEAITNIIEELSNQYTLGYRPSNQARDGRWRSIELKLTRTELKARTRNGYRAPKS